MVEVARSPVVVRVRAPVGPWGTATAGRRAQRLHGPGAAGVRRARIARRRALAATLLVVIGLGARMAGPAQTAPLRSAVSAGHGEGDRAERVVAQPGDSLWSIVSRVAPERDPRPLVHELAGRRGGTDVMPGEVVTVRW